MSFNVDIRATGSTGNYNIIDEKILIDIGVTRKFALENDIDKIEHIFISHQHGDHLNVAPLNWLMKNKPQVIRHGLHVNDGTFAKIESVAPKLAAMIGAPRLTDHDNFEFSTSDKTYTMRTYPLIHDVQIQGFILENSEGDKLIHATDTETMKYAPHEKFNYLLVEGNWDEESLFASLDVDASDEEFGRATRNFRHLSIQMCHEFILSHATVGAKAWQLHESGEFGFTIDLSHGSKELIENMDKWVK